MALKSQVIEIPIHQGVNTGVDIKLLQKGLSMSRNCILNRYGNIEKRQGFAHSSNWFSSSDSTRIFSNNKEGYCGATKAVHYKLTETLGETSGPSEIHERSLLENLGVSVAAIDNQIVSLTSNGSDIEYIEFDSDSETGVILYRDSVGNFYAKDFDNGVGTLTYIAGSGSKCRLLNFGGTPYILANDSGDIKLRPFAAGSWTAFSTIATNIATACYPDVKVVNSNVALLTYVNSSALFVQANMTKNGTVFATESTATGGSGYADFNTCWYNSGTGKGYSISLDQSTKALEVEILDDVGSSTTAPSRNTGAFVATVSSNNITGFGWTGYSSAYYSVVVLSEKIASNKTVDVNVKVLSGSSVIDSIATGSMWPVTQANSDGFFWAKHCPYNAGSEPPVDDFGYFLYSLTQLINSSGRNGLDVLGTIYSDRIYYDETTYYNRAPSNFHGDRVFFSLAYNDAQQDFLIAGSEITTTTDFSSDTHDGSIILSTSRPWIITQEGDEIDPAFFHEYPYAIDIAATASVSTSDYLWQYAAIFKYVYEDGRVSFSRPSPVGGVYFSTSAFSTTTVKVGVPHTFGDRAVAIQLFRTNVNDNVLRFISENRVFRGTIVTTFNDTASDDATRTPELEFSLAGVNPINVNGSLLPYDYPMLSCTGAVAFNRYFSVDASRRNRIYYTQDLGYSLGLRFSDDEDFRLAIDVPDNGGDIVALKQLDDKLLIFKENAIYATYGDGKGVTGEGDGYVTPFLVSNSIGCRDRLSVARIPDGLMFMSKSGLKLIDRSLQISHIGDRIRYWLLDADTVPTSLRAVNWPDKDAVLWTTDINLVIYYNYKYSYFSTWTTKSSSGGEPRWAALLGDRMVWGLENGYTFFNEGTYGYSDKVPLGSTTVIDMAIVTGWMSLAGIGSNVRCKNVNVVADNESSTTSLLILGSQYDMLNRWYNTTVTVAEQLDYKDFFTVTGSASVTAVGSFHLALPRQKCTAIRLKLLESSGKKGFSIQAVSMEVARKEGIRFHQDGKAFS